MIPQNPFYAALLGGVIFCTALGIIGGLFTVLSPWYFALKQPSWKPPDWAFGPVWTTIFICLSFAIAHAWNAGNGQQHQQLLWALAINGVLNIAWTLIFFTLQKPALAMAELVVFWLSIVWLIYVMGSVSRISIALLLPYILWVTTAGILNFNIVLLNR
jgi:translocator protein